MEERLLHIRGGLRSLVRAEILGSELGHHVRLEGGEVTRGKRSNDLGCVLPSSEIRARQLAVPGGWAVDDAGPRSPPSSRSNHGRPRGQGAVVDPREGPSDLWWSLGRAMR